MIIVFLLLLIDLLLAVCTIVAPGLSKKSLEAKKKPKKPKAKKPEWTPKKEHPKKYQKSSITKWNRGGIQFSIETRRK